MLDSKYSQIFAHRNMLSCSIFWFLLPKDKQLSFLLKFVTIRAFLKYLSFEHMNFKLSRNSFKRVGEYSNIFSRSLTTKDCSCVKICGSSPRFSSIPDSNNVFFRTYIFDLGSCDFWNDRDSCVVKMGLLLCDILEH